MATKDNETEKNENLIILSSSSWRCRLGMSPYFDVQFKATRNKLIINPKEFCFSARVQVDLIPIAGDECADQTIKTTENIIR